MHLDAGGRRDVGGGDGTGTGLAEVHRDGLVVLGGDDQALQVEDDLGDVLGDALNGRELVEDGVHLDARDRRPRNGGQEGTAKRVAERVAEAGLEGLDDEARTELVHGLLGQGRALSDKHLFFLPGSNHHLMDPISRDKEASETAR